LDDELAFAVCRQRPRGGSPVTKRDLTRLVVDFSSSVEQAGGRCVFMGAVALPVWGRPRATADADALLLLSETKFEAFAEILAGIGLLTTPADLRDAYEERSHVTFVDQRGPFHVDGKFARSPAELSEVESAKRIELPEGTFYVTAVEETIAFKLSYGSAQDLEDVRGILAISGDQIDPARLGPILADLGVTQVYRQLQEEIARRGAEKVQKQRKGGE